VSLSKSGKRHDGVRRSNEERWLRRLAVYCWRFKRDVIIAVAGAILYTAASLAIPLLQRGIIDDVIVTRKDSVWPLAIGLLIAAVANFFGIYMRRYRGGKMALEVQHQMRTDLFESLSKLDGARQDEIHTGQLVGRSISDVNMVQQLLQWAPLILGSVLLFVFSLIIMIALSPLLAVVALLVAPALWLIAVASKRKLFPASWHAQQVVGEVAGIVDETVGGVRVVKGFGQEEREMERMEATSEELFGSRLRVTRLTARYNPALTALPSIGLVGVLALGGWLAIHGQITLGTFLAFSSYIATLSGPVRVLTNIVTIGQEARASVIRVFEVIDSKPVITDKPDAIDLPAEANGITFSGVKFGYVPSQPVLRGLTLTVNPGETVAVIGPSGSGKSTLSLLLPRFYDVRGGAVKIGGYDVRDVTENSLRSAIGMVMEESFLFSDSVKANIAYGRPDATDEQVIAAAKAAEADEFIRELPQGYDTVIGEQGLTLSGGQRQRVALARALITNPRLLLLDDATSAVDPRIEAEIHATLHRVMEGRTTLLIAHRKSTLNLADRIAVLNSSGQVADVGTDAELTERSELYRVLITGPEMSETELSGPDTFRHRDDVDTLEAAAGSAGGGVRRRGTGETTTRYEDRGAARALTAAGTLGLAGRGGAAAGGRGARSGRGAAGRNASFDGMIGSVPPSPELLAKVAALPPVKDEPKVDIARARAGDYSFTLRKLLKPIAIALVAGLVLDGLDALASLALPALVRGGIDQGVQAKAFHVVVLMAVIGLAIVFADWLVNIAETMVVGRNGERLLFTLRVKLFAQLQRLGLDFYERELSGRIMTRMTSDIDALSSFLQTGLVTMVSSLLTFVGVLAAMLVINAELGLLVLAIVPVLAVATVIFRQKSSKAYTEARERISVVNADLAENVAGLRVTQAFRREGVNSGRFAGRSAAYRSSRLRAQKYIALYFPFVQTLSTIASALVLVVAVSQVRSGVLSVGALIAYLLYIDMVFSPIQSLSQVFDGYQQAAVGLSRIKDLLRLRTTVPAAADPVPVPQDGFTGRIELRDVRFAYRTGSTFDGADVDATTANQAIAGVSFTITPGETVALVGQTGAGKSTIVKLMARFYDVTSGAVLVDGVDVRKYDLAEFRHRLGVVPQEAYLFSGTVADAVAYARPGASLEEIEAAARAVGAHDMITALPDGYDHEVGERGRNLSAGQRQLIALARAELADPDILLLDEATAALDLASEAAVNAATDQLTLRRTTVIVAHRLTTAARADRIIVMDHGRVAETGSHDELVAAGGVYAGLWAAFVGETEYAALASTRDAPSSRCINPCCRHHQFPAAAGRS
jgi:ATP-binding cassette, subfamily B, bacterial